MSRFVRAAVRNALAAATAGSVALLAAVLLSHHRGYHLQWVRATGCEVIVDRGQIEVNRYGAWATPDGGFTFAALPAPPPLPGVRGGGYR